MLEKECELFTIQNKHKKMEVFVEGKDKKIAELEKLIMENDMA